MARQVERGVGVGNLAPRCAARVSDARETQVCGFNRLFLFFQGVFGGKWFYLHGQDVTIPT